MGAIEKRAGDELEVIQRKQRDQVEDLVVLLDGVADILTGESDETAIAKAIRRLLAPKGDREPLRGDSRVQRPQLPAAALEALQGASLGHDAGRARP